MPRYRFNPLLSPRAVNVPSIKKYSLERRLFVTVSDRETTAKTETFGLGERQVLVPCRRLSEVEPKPERLIGSPSFPLIFRLKPPFSLVQVSSPLIV